MGHLILLGLEAALLLELLADYDVLFALFAFAPLCLRHSLRRILRWIHGGHAGRHLGLAPPLATIRIATPILTHRILGLRVFGSNPSGMGLASPSKWINGLVA